MKYKYIFGPVASSRLGVSLGLDLLGGPVCTYDCLYCEVGRTTDKTLARKPYVPADKVLDELARWKKRNNPPEVVTLGGMGEPCLNSDLAEILAGAKQLFPDLPVAVLTNASLLWDERVRRELAGADVVLPSMDSLVDKEFRALNKPHRSLHLDQVIQGLVDFRWEFEGRLYLEVLLARGVNDSAENLELLQPFVRALWPDRVDVVTMSRPGAYAKARPVPEATLAAWREALSGHAAAAEPARTERLRHQGLPRTGGSAGDVADAVLASLDRRPQTAPQLAQGLGFDLDSVRRALASLAEQGHIRKYGNGADDEPFYKSAAHD